LAQIIDGKLLARAIREEVKRGVQSLTRAPRLIAVQVGHDDASASYTRSQARTAEKLGITYHLETLPEETSLDDLGRAVKDLAKPEDVAGLMLQTPLPPQLDPVQCRRLIPLELDVEAVTEAAAGRLFHGTHRVAPCTAVAALECLKAGAGGDVTGLHVAIFGRSAIVGKPLALLLLQANASPSILHTRTREPARIASGADAVVVAVGRPRLVGADMVGEGAIVIDVGTNWDAAANRLVGDVRFDEVEPKAAAITPVPGGVGPVTTAVLMRNLLTLARLRER